MRDLKNPLSHLSSKAPNPEPVETVKVAQQIQGQQQQLAGQMWGGGTRLAQEDCRGGAANGAHGAQQGMCAPACRTPAQPPAMTSSPRGAGLPSLPHVLIRRAATPWQ